MRKPLKNGFFRKLPKNNFNKVINTELHCHNLYSESYLVLLMPRLIDMYYAGNMLNTILYLSLITITNSALTYLSYILKVSKFDE